MPLVESLVAAIVQADGDALVMHVGDRPYVVAANGPVDVSSHPLSAHTMSGVLTQLLPADARRMLTSSGTVEHELPQMTAMPNDRFTVAAANGGDDDLWIDIRRHRRPRVEPATGVERIVPPPTWASGGASPSGAEVIPMMRPRRSDTAASGAGQPVTASRIERLVGLALARGATTLYLTSDAAPCVRIDGGVSVLDGAPALSAGEVEATLAELAPEDLRESLRRGDTAEWALEFPGTGRVNCNTFRDYRGPGAIFQLVSVRPPTAEQLGLMPAAQSLATETDGLVIVATPRQQGKSTVAGALVDFINHRRHCYVITLERQIRVVHPQQAALVSQRAVHGSGDRAVATARAALAENPDVLVIDEVPSAEILQLAFDAAGAGALVIATVTAGSCVSALKRLVELVAESRRAAVHALLAARLRGVIGQVLLHRSAGGRVAARELMFATGPVQRALAAGQFGELPLVVERGQKQGMLSLNDSLVGLVRNGSVDVREAYRKADDREGLLRALRRESIDMTLIDRLA